MRRYFESLVLVVMTGFVACQSPEAVAPPTEVALRPKSPLGSGLVETSITRVTVEDYGGLVTALRCRISVDKLGTIIRTEFASAGQASGPVATCGVVPPAQRNFMLRWLQAEYPRLAKINADEGVCEGGCLRLKVQLEGGSEDQWTFSPWNESCLPLQAVVELLEGIAARTNLSQCSQP